MPDRPLPMTDMAPFFAHQDRTARRLFAMMLGASLLVTAATLAYAVSRSTAPAALLARLWQPLLAFPLLIVLLWALTAHAARQRRTLADGRLPMIADDARSMTRVARAGSAFILFWGLIIVATQLFEALADLGLLHGLTAHHFLVTRISVAAAGLLTAWFGNAWSRLPVPRHPALQPARQIRFKRLVAWLLVIHGLLMALAALVPSPRGVTLGVLAVGASLVLSMAATILLGRRTRKPPVSTAP